MSKTKIIAEIGVNHNGSINLAKKLILAAKRAGADSVKFQTYITEDLVIKNSPLAEYQKKNLNNQISQYDLLKKYELKFSDMIKILNFCKKNNIEFISSAFDNKSLKFLLSLNINYIKIPSGENDNDLLLSLLSKTNNSIIQCQERGSEEDMMCTHIYKILLFCSLVSFTIHFSAHIHIYDIIP